MKPRQKTASYKNTLIEEYSSTIMTKDLFKRIKKLETECIKQNKGAQLETSFLAIDTEHSYGDTINTLVLHCRTIFPETNDDRLVREKAARLRRATKKMNQALQEKETETKERAQLRNLKAKYG